MPPTHEPIHPGDLVEMRVSHKRGLFIANTWGELFWIDDTVVEGALAIAIAGPARPEAAQRVLLLCHNGMLGWCWADHLKRMG